MTVLVSILILSPAKANAFVLSGICSSAASVAGLCETPSSTGSIANGGVDVTAGYEDSSGGDTADAGASSGSGGNDEPGAGVPVGGVAAETPPRIQRDGFTVNCIPRSPCDPTLVVRISDLVNFRSTAPAQVMEPDGWAVTGLPINFYAVASVNVQSGTLLGYSADVRFTPIGYHWDYGDGTASSSRSGGSSWAALGQPEFSTTSTSHVFASRGVMAVTLSVEYSAEYRFASQSWREVQGTLALSADPLIAVAGDAKTVLVGQDCSRNPTGPGC
ncbi:hypothetical protein [Leifsonia sp. A12D58]|uniref:hypothetical protein n=1 Tax=Leifsonia sp. A12D58 TaxID=3397674 RepID=UPI0039E1299C